MNETSIMHLIQQALSPHGVVFRISVGTIKTQDGRYFSTGVMPGFSDLFGFRFSDGRAFFIECKKPGGAVTPAQKHFIETVKSYGALAGIARSADDALKIIQEVPND